MNATQEYAQDASASSAGGKPSWHQLSAEEVLDKLGVKAEAGVSDSEIQVRQRKYGPNELEEGQVKSKLSIFLAQFKEIMVIILIIAALISAFLGEYIDATVIAIIVVLNAILGYTQEYRAEQAMAALKKLSTPTVRVRRNGKVTEVSSTELVPGDIVLLEAGNLVPADGRIIESVNLKVQEAALTGESEPVEKSAETVMGEDVQLGDRSDMLYMGTVVTYGRGAMVVTETGMKGELGRIASLIHGVEDAKTPLQRRLDHLGKTLAWAALAIIAIVVVINIDFENLSNTDWELLFLTGVSMAVAAIPESLPAMVTITLALGAQRLLKRRALMRRLPAVETLGSVTYICSDKTGTLTENRMTVTLVDVAGNTESFETLTQRGEELLEARLLNESAPDLAALSMVVRVGALCNDAVLEKDEEEGGYHAIGDPTEGALILAAHELGWDLEALQAEWPRVAEIPFTSDRKRMTTIHRMTPIAQQYAAEVPWAASPYVFFTKGAVDGLLEITDSVLVDKEFVPLDDELRQRIIETNERYALEGQRVLGMAVRVWEDPELPEKITEDLENHMIFVGMVAMMDPARPEVKAAVETAKQAGIHPVMITGDHPLTALAIAHDLHITDNDRFITGQELATMSPEKLNNVVEEVAVYARVAPEHKLNIVQALQEKGEIVAMTGDGVNDAPALKQADIGVAMGVTGTDVSKEAADMILLDDNFATIVAAVEEGRVIFDNIRKFIKYTLSSNTGELFLMLVGPLIGMPLPLLPLQILWINLVTDGLPGLALAVEPAERGVMKRSPFKPTESVFSRGIGPEIIGIGLFMGIASLLVGYIYWAINPDGPWQTMIFTTLTIAQMANALGTRTNRDSLFSVGLFSNMMMIGAVLLTFVLQLMLLYIPFFHRIFATQALSARDLSISLAVSVGVLVVIEIYKWVRRRVTG